MIRCNRQRAVVAQQPDDVQVWHARLHLQQTSRNVNTCVEVACSAVQSCKACLSLPSARSPSKYCVYPQA